MIGACLMSHTHGLDAECTTMTLCMLPTLLQARATTLPLAPGIASRGTVYA